jgi:hypothetical protein
MFWLWFSPRASTSGTNFGDSALAVDGFVNIVNRPLVNTPMSVHDVEDLHKDQRVC